MKCVAERDSGKWGKTALEIMAILTWMAVFLSGNPAAWSGVESVGSKVAFQWAFGALPGGGGDDELKPVSRETVLKTGDQLKMMVQLEKPCYVYVFHQDAGENVALLFPYALGQPAANVEIGRAYYIPEGDAWFELDEQPGKEVFTVLASPERLRRLEELYMSYRSARGEQKVDSKRQLLDEMRSLKRQQRELAAPAERPVTIGGTVRAYRKPSAKERPDVASIADAIRSDGIVVRVFSVEHR